MPRPPEGLLVRQRVLAAIAVVGLVCGSVRAASTKADRIFVNGRIWTGNPAQPWAQALAIRGPKILAVGDTAAIQKLKEKPTEVVDLKGRLMLPGFNDAHLHVLSGSLELDNADLSEATNVAEVQQRIATFAAAHPDRPWIVGRGWTYGAFPGGLPQRQQLDAVVSDRPAFMTAYDGHTAWCNTAALTLAGIARSTPNPAGGAIVRDAAGEATGALKESAMALVRLLAPRPGPEDKSRALRKGLALAASYGLTSVQDASFDLDDLPIYERVQREGGAKLRVYAALPMAKAPTPDELASYKELRAKYKSAQFRIGAVKGYVDGVVESKTAAMLEPYTGGGTGQANFSAAELNRAVAAYDREGFQIFLHAIGDKAIRMALDAYQNAATQNGSSGRRHRVEHVEAPQAAEIARFGPLGVIASTQALFANPDKNTLEVYAVNLGPERSARAMAFKALDDAGAVQAFGSDWPVVSCDVLRGIYCAVTRMTPEGTPAGGWQPQQRITVEAALRHFTRDAAYASFEETIKGTLEADKAADLVVLSENILEIAPERILKTRVMLTVMGGNDTYRAKEF
jgi:predicted amidohydrolase YtcJ